MIKEFSEELAKKVKGVEAIMGQTPDYTELVLRHLWLTGDNLCSTSMRFARTKTRVVDGIHKPIFPVVNIFGDKYVNIGGLEWNDPGYNIDIFAAPLIVPVK